MAKKTVILKGRSVKHPTINVSVRRGNATVSQKEFDRILKAMLRPNPAKKSKKR